MQNQWFGFMSDVSGEQSGVASNNGGSRCIQHKKIVLVTAMLMVIVVLVGSRDGIHLSSSSIHLRNDISLQPQKINLSNVENPHLSSVLRSTRQVTEGTNSTNSENTENDDNHDDKEVDKVDSNKKDENESKKGNENKEGNDTKKKENEIGDRSKEEDSGSNEKESESNNENAEDKNNKDNNEMKDNEAKENKENKDTKEKEINNDDGNKEVKENDDKKKEDKEANENKEDSKESTEVDEEDDEDYLSISNGDDDDDRPIMHTFFEKVFQGENHLLHVWEKEWQRIGFHTKVLTMEHATKHPFYEEMKEMVDPVWGETYNGLCYYRWLAMSYVGGGWMSDYDTFPTHFPIEEGKNLPNGGNFTSFQAHVPSLMSASGDEWIRVTKSLVHAMPRIQEGNIKSDMYSFLQLRIERNHSINFLSPDENVARGYLYAEAGKVKCESMSTTRAVHLSHYATHLALEKGVFPIQGKGNAMYHRGAGAKIFLRQWRDQCTGKHLEIE